MFPKKGAKLLQESTGERSYGATADPGSTEPEAKIETENIALCESAPAILEPSKDAHRPPKPSNQNALEDSGSPPINPWRRLVTCSDPAPPTRVYVNANGQSNLRAAHERPIVDEQQVDEHLGAWPTFVKGYYKAAIWLRTSIFIYVFQVLFSIIPISASVMGILYSGKCDASPALPFFGEITGSLGIVFAILWMTISCCSRRGGESWEVVQGLFMMISLGFLLFAVADVCIFAAMSPSFDPLASNYCDRTFYYYALYKEIATGVAAALFALLYIPGSLVYLRCRCFITPAHLRELW